MVCFNFSFSSFLIKLAEYEMVLLNKRTPCSLVLTKKYLTALLVSEHHDQCVVLFYWLIFFLCLRLKIEACELYFSGYVSSYSSKAIQPFWRTSNLYGYYFLLQNVRFMFPYDFICPVNCKRWFLWLPQTSFVVNFLKEMQCQGCFTL